jgi:hypothetical protein
VHEDLFFIFLRIHSTPSERVPSAGIRPCPYQGTRPGREVADPGGRPSTDPEAFQVCGDTAEVLDDASRGEGVQPEPPRTQNGLVLPE